MDLQPAQGRAGQEVEAYGDERSVLLALLVIDGYHKLGDAVDEALASVDDADLFEHRWKMLVETMRLVSP